FDEALRVSELQASCLIDIVGGPDRIDATAISALPHVRVVLETIAVSGMSLWTGNHWLIAINSGDSLAHQRFTLLHQFKHVVDHGHAAALYSGSPIATSTVQAERAADYFAGCVLVPKRELEALWDGGLRQPQTLAAHFGVSVDAMLVRLGQVKLNAANDRLPH
ncbi:ImmA/IrrE family metallo-endopeptidase, partial [Curtobacterium sp. MMLR14_002]|uniref:ImmA/IrrE family metallo-endopeptidase n=1 Tax=Curtobacterium sp. MMLR14_002 TaxID=1898741 RepID=UPI0008F8554B